MKVILLKDVKSLGKKGDLVNASDGYARNYLIPKKLAEQATENNVHILNNKKEAERRQKLKELEEAQKLAKSLMGKEIKFKVKIGENGRLFGSITSKDISEKLKEQYNMDIDKKKIVAETIRQTGVYEAEIKIYPEVSTKVKVSVLEE
ncbi:MULTISPECIES: 50S ribosomal protein L9 [Clostridium]|jgi:large subunit ribosomal protein L9|uniref:Large ribosomal subunit protein bL9 n=10 Tax=Clostridium TaxID=1485 RepID=RL9_CLOB6|nr:MULTISPECIES: 50S ribosomal protein L9 [Clostridium]A7GJL8.1 RecName: Full=Large ribosomal subunit protein bL9; AltName: Full=50S ribosomal protein L9 [Clostridium botulinum F str. Langeland]B1IHP8.1 RecName: Full=Large ribosomal subunit protein bL9; AltName: Full=50S ribosomal protein L9 [Clostridium botulinum B1 str. Okra]B1KU91.1 RecName: Full=Large ribosomal subunit protein bL9; AltName: Full=50S ribosomal protein L9 [Clostridium botulinum A3 str. Loch Maree]C1FP10.1 RecName: Full=Large 